MKQNNQDNLDVKSATYRNVWTDFKTSVMVFFYSALL